VRVAVEPPGAPGDGQRTEVGTDAGVAGAAPAPAGAVAQRAALAEDREPVAMAGDQPAGCERNGVPRAPVRRGERSGSEQRARAAAGVGVEADEHGGGGALRVDVQPQGGDLAAGVRTQPERLGTARDQRVALGLDRRVAQQHLGRPSRAGVACRRRVAERRPRKGERTHDEGKHDRRHQSDQVRIESPGCASRQGCVAADPRHRSLPMSSSLSSGCPAAALPGRRIHNAAAGVEIAPPEARRPPAAGCQLVGPYCTSAGFQSMPMPFGLFLSW
jgi:hypothetical protein